MNEQARTRRPMISVVGEDGLAQDAPACQSAREVGRQLVEAGFRVCCGGMSGVMEAVLAGAREAAAYREGDTVAVIPMLDRNRANPHADIVIATGMGHARNAIVANSDAVVVIAGGAGTLSEVALAWTFNRLIIALPASGGTAEKIADTAVDHRARGDIGALAKVWPAKTPEHAVALLEEHLPACTLPPHRFREK